MYIEKHALQASFGTLDGRINDYRLPSFDELPDLALYMDQVITFIRRELAFFGMEPEKLLTPSMVNNYVKLGFIPPPIKKKYTRVHLAKLLIICTLKQTLDIADITAMLPDGADEDAVKAVYDSFVHNQHKAFAFVSDAVRAVADPILALPDNAQERFFDLAFQVAVSANLFKIYTSAVTNSIRKP